MAKEIEILVELKTDFEKAKTILDQFEFKRAKCVKDYYYADPLRQNLQFNSEHKLMECCRIRQKDDACFVTYKVDKYDGKTWLYSDEYETRFTDLTAMQHIFSYLGLQLLVTIDNTKYTYESDIYEIVLEDVKNLGHFLEVEYIGSDTDASVSDIKNTMREFISGLGLDIGDELNAGKPEMLLAKQST